MPTILLLLAQIHFNPFNSLLQVALQAYQSAGIQLTTTTGCITGKKLAKKVYDTGYSQAVTHPSTNPAQCCLTSVIGQELVLSAWYGHRHSLSNSTAYLYGPLQEQFNFLFYKIFVLYRGSLVKCGES